MVLNSPQIRNAITYNLEVGQSKTQWPSSVYKVQCKLCGTRNAKLELLEITFIYQALIICHTVFDCRAYSKIQFPQVTQVAHEALSNQYRKQFHNIFKRAKYLFQIM